MYYYSTIRLIYHSLEGGRLSRPRHCIQCAARAQSCVSQWFSWKHKLLSAARFEPGQASVLPLDQCDLHVRKAKLHTFPTVASKVDSEKVLAVSPSVETTETSSCNVVEDRTWTPRTAPWMKQLILLRIVVCTGDWCLRLLAVHSRNGDDDKSFLLRNDVEMCEWNMNLVLQGAEYTWCDYSCCTEHQSINQSINQSKSCIALHMEHGWKCLVI